MAADRAGPVCCESSGIGKVTAAERREEFEAQLRPVKTFNIVVGIVGIMVGLTMILIFAL